MLAGSLRLFRVVLAGSCDSLHSGLQLISRCFPDVVALFVDTSRRVLWMCRFRQEVCGRTVVSKLLCRSRLFTLCLELNLFYEIKLSRLQKLREHGHCELQPRTCVIGFTTAEYSAARDSCGLIWYSNCLQYGTSKYPTLTVFIVFSDYHLCKHSLPPL